jgi:hypothetical protein
MTTGRVDHVHFVDSFSLNVLEDFVGYRNCGRRRLHWDAQCIHPKEGVGGDRREPGQSQSGFDDLCKVCLEHTKLACWQTILESISQTISPHVRYGNISRKPGTLLDSVLSKQSQS